MPPGSFCGGSDVARAHSFCLWIVGCGLWVVDICCDEREVVQAQAEAEAGMVAQNG